MVRAKQGRNSHWTKVLDLERPGVHGGARAGIALLPTSEARGLESRSAAFFVFFGGEGRLRSRGVNGSSLSTPGEKAARTFTSRERGREVAGPERPVQTLPHGQRVC